MGLVNELQNLRVCIDTAPIIYFIEGCNKYLATVKSIFRKLMREIIEMITSTITLLEVLVQPFKAKNITLAEKERNILLNNKGLITFEISHQVSELAAKLKAKYGIKTPDAIQIAVGIINRADVFLTNDSALKKVKDIKILVLNDFL